MRDLCLYHRLVSNEVDESDTADLEALAEAPLRDRAAFLEGLISLSLSPVSRLRELAMRGLSGALGVKSLRAIVRGLGDADIEVWLAALHSLRQSASTEPGRWAHALFHHRAEVRAAALRLEPPHGAESFVPALIALDDTEAAVVQQLECGRARPPAGQPIAWMLGQLRKGRVPVGLVIKTINQASDDQMERFVDSDVARGDREVERALRGATRHGGDVIDSYLRLTRLAAPDVQRGLLRRLVELVWKKPSLGRRAAAAARLHVREGGPATTLELVAIGAPEVLGRALLPRHQRRAALALLHWKRQPPWSKSEAVFEELLESDLATTHEGYPDLWALSAIALLGPAGSVARILETFDQEKIIGATAADPASASPFFATPEALQDRDAQKLLTLLRERNPEAASLCEATALLYVDPTPARLARVIPTAKHELFRFAEALMKLEGASEIPPKRCRAIAAALVSATTEWTKLVHLWLQGDSPRESELGRAIFVEVSRACAGEQFLSTCDRIPDGLKAILVGILPDLVSLHFERERLLANAWVASAEDAVREWAQKRCTPLQMMEQIVPQTALSLADDELERIVAAASIDDALKDFPKPCRGLCAALARRAAVPSAEACVALFGCHDDLASVATQLGRFAVATLDQSVVKAWLNRRMLPLHLHAWLYRWEQHAIAATELLAEAGTLSEGLLAFSDLTFGRLRVRGWAAVARAFGCLQYGKMAKLRSLVDPQLASTCVRMLDTELGIYAAHILVLVHQSRAVAVDIVELEAELHRFSSEVRSVLRPLVASDEPPAQVQLRAIGNVDERLALIRQSTCVDVLWGFVGSEDERICDESIQRLFELGAPGEQALLDLLESDGFEGSRVARFAGLFETVSAERLLHAMTHAQRPETGFRLALELGSVEAAIRWACEETEELWLEAVDVETLRKRLGETVIPRLALSPHPHAYRPAVESLLEQGDAEGLYSFLYASSRRDRMLRTRVALHLWRQGDARVTPILIGAVLDPDVKHAPRLTDSLQALVFSAALAMGAQSETRMLKLWRAGDGALLPEVASQLIDEGLCPDLRLTAALELRRAAGEHVVHERAREIAECFAWGVRRGRELNGRLFSFHLVPEYNELGYTYTTSSRIWISIAPLLRRQRFGRAIVEGLILHEIGHHMYHRGRHEHGVWDQAQKEDLHHLLNLIADEHLERNLRAIDAQYGDRLKRLNAYAFHHLGRELKVSELLNRLGTEAGSALCSVELGVAFGDEAVIVNSGALLQALEDSGNGFASFVRALRMGQGSRGKPSKVKQALRLFGKRFRHATMSELLDIARQVRDLFELEAQLAKAVGGHEGTHGPPGSEIHGPHIDDAEVQREVERILKPPSQSPRSVTGRGLGSLQINVGPDESFEPIREIERAHLDLSLHREVALEIAPEIRMLREALTSLGLASSPTRARLRGHRFDRQRAQALVTRRDPRILVARERQPRNDLFLGVAIDCSGSMYGASMDKAHRFGVLIAEAVAPLRGIDAHFVGFTDSTLIDAGDDHRCAVTALEPGGGNNDAAGLWHVAGLARASQRSSKLLVMISDGLPTECSVASLRGLVSRLERRDHLRCAQVAVRPLEERCFRDYVEVLDADLAQSVRRFGKIVARLARSAIGAR